MDRRAGRGAGADQLPPQLHRERGALRQARCGCRARARSRRTSASSGLIPGSMGTASYVVEGLGNPVALNSSPHGAGREFSRYGGTARRSRTSSCGRRWRHRVPRHRRLPRRDPGGLQAIDQVMADAASTCRGAAHAAAARQREGGLRGGLVPVFEASERMPRLARWGSVRAAASIPDNFSPTRPADAPLGVGPRRPQPRPRAGTCRRRGRAARTSPAGWPRHPDSSPPGNRPTAVPRLLTSVSDDISEAAADIARTITVRPTSDASVTSPTSTT